MSDGSSCFKKRVIESLNSLENSSRLLKDKVKTSTLDERFFKKINFYDYEKISNSISLWVKILEHAEMKKRFEETK
jgi:hypothetical protein